MAWVRYDDRFHDHDKVAHLRASSSDVSALALHVLANTWTSASTTPGFVPQHVPAMLVGRDNAARWVPALLKAKLWRKARGGWEFVNHERYRASANRQTPGTPEDLSRKRAEAGSRGGRATAAKKAANTPDTGSASGAASAASNSASAEQAASNTCSPEPVPVVPSNEGTSAAVAAPPRTDVERMCRYFLAGLASNGVKATLTERWRTEARLMLDKDERDPLEIKAVMDFALTDSFWKANVHGVPKLREQFDKLRLGMESRRGPVRAELRPADAWLENM